MTFLPAAFEILLAVQAAQATLLGTVRDRVTGEPLAGAVVALVDLERAVVTDRSGRYVLSDVPAGPQHVTIRLIGYAQRSLHALVPRRGELEINVTLAAEPIPLERIEVRPMLTVRGVETGDSTAYPDRGISIAAVRNHPLLPEPDVFQALSGGEVVVKPESPSGIHVRGGASDQTAYLLDGIPVISPYHSVGVFSAWNPDAISRLDLYSAAPSPELPDALSGAVAAVTRVPGSRLRAQGSVSTTQARLTVDGPLGAARAGAGAGYLFSLRSGFPDAFAPRGEASYVRGESGDLLAKLEAPSFGGRVRFIGYESENEIDAASAIEGAAGSSAGARRNLFEWRSRSVGAVWTRTFGSTLLRIQGWNAAGDASAFWSLSSTAAAHMAANRDDQGLLAAIELRSAGATTVAGLRFVRSRTEYRFESDSSSRTGWAVRAETPVAAAFIQHRKPMGARVEAELGASLAAAVSAVHLGPRAQLYWLRSDRLTLSAGYARLHQFAQSLRNAESVVGNIFPVDLYLGAGAAGVPVARSDQGVVAAEYRPVAGVRLGLQAYARSLDGLALVAPSEAEPFTTGTFATGSGASRGIALDAAVSGARFGVVASYGWQRVRFTYGDSGFVPDYGASHLVDAGVIVFPTASSSVRVGATGALGRRATGITGGLEWEACNLLDQGCEFSGSPRIGSEPLGAMNLPAYLRVDLGVRKHWHITPASRDAQIALFGTVTNVLGRGNVLTYARDPSTGKRVEIEMRPRAPLVVGIDWRF